MERVGFIGLGAMGQPMARRLREAGYVLSVHARRPFAVQPLVEAGACAYDSPRELAASNDVVFTAVTTTADVEQVVLGERGIVHGAAPGSIHVDMSTISPLASRGIAAALDARGIAMVDAPVSGEPMAAQAGTRSIRVEGNFEAGIDSRLHHKDMHMVLELARALGLAVAAAAATTGSFDALVGAGGGKLDSAALLQVILGITQQ